MPTISMRKLSLIFLSIIVFIGVGLTQFATNVEATDPFFIGQPCELISGAFNTDEGGNYYINVQRTHHNDDGKTIDLPIGGPSSGTTYQGCNNNKAIAAINGHLTIGESKDNDGGACGSGTPQDTYCGWGYHAIITDYVTGNKIIYGHLQPGSILRTGHVNEGEHIATIGASGNTTGPHIHLELHNSDDTVAYTYSQWKFRKNYNPMLNSPAHDVTVNTYPGQNIGFSWNLPTGRTISGLEFEFHDNGNEFYSQNLSTSATSLSLPMSVLQGHMSTVVKWIIKVSFSDGGSSEAARHLTYKFPGPAFVEPKQEDQLFQDFTAEIDLFNSDSNTSGLIQADNNGNFGSLEFPVGTPTWDGDGVINVSLPSGGTYYLRGKQKSLYFADESSYNNTIRVYIKEKRIGYIDDQGQFFMNSAEVDSSFYEPLPSETIVKFMFEGARTAMLTDDGDLYVGEPDPDPMVSNIVLVQSDVSDFDLDNRNIIYTYGGSDTLAVRQPNLGSSSVDLGTNIDTFAIYDNRVVYVSQAGNLYAYQNITSPSKYFITSNVKEARLGNNRIVYLKTNDDLYGIDGEVDDPSYLIHDDVKHFSLYRDRVGYVDFSDGLYVYAGAFDNITSTPAGVAVQTTQRVKAYQMEGTMVGYIDENDKFYIKPDLQTARIAIDSSTNVVDFNLGAESTYYLTDSNNLKKYSHAGQTLHSLIADVQSFKSSGDRLAVQKTDDTLYAVNESFTKTNSTVGDIVAYAVDNKDRRPTESGYYVNPVTTFNIADGDEQSLIEAIEAANFHRAPTDIYLATSGTYSFDQVYQSTNNALPVIIGNITIHGDGAVIEKVNNPSLDFRAFSVSDNGYLELSDLTISEFVSPDQGGAIYLDEAGELVTDNVTFEQNSATNQGGAISAVDEDNAVSIVGGTFTGNFSETSNAGAINLSYGVLDIDGVTFNGNYATSGSGGAIRTYHASNINIDNGTEFIGNYAQDKGGAVFITEHDTSPDANMANIINVTFEDNYTANGLGGALYSNYETVNIEDSTFDGNYVSAGSAGAVRVYKGRLDITDSTLNDNTAVTTGGAVESVDAKINIYGTTVLSNNNAGTDGGAISTNHDLKLDSTTLSGNTATAGVGGAVNIVGDAVLDLDDIAFTNNTANQQGGAIFASDDDVQMTITGGTFSGNQSTNSNAGAINLSYGSLDVDDIDFTNNTAINGSGGALRLYKNAGVSFGTNTTFTNNTADDFGGALYITVDNGDTSTPVTISTVTFTGNTSVSGRGGAIASEYEAVNITGSTFEENEAALNGGAIRKYHGIYNMHTTDFTDNSGLNGGAIANEGGTFNANDNNFTDNVATTTAADGGGGAIFNTGTLNIAKNSVRSTFTGNIADQANALGGAILSTNAGALAHVQYADFDDNEAKLGAAIYSTTDTILRVNFGKFTNNKARHSGAAIRSYKADELSVYDSTFSNNKIVDSGYNVITGNGNVIRSNSTGTATGVKRNCFNGNNDASSAVLEDSGTTLDARDNWWGASTGPNTTNADGKSGSVNSTGYKSSTSGMSCPA